LQSEEYIEEDKDGEAKEAVVDVYMKMIVFWTMVVVA
jgi:hypothetical protein